MGPHEVNKIKSKEIKILLIFRDGYRTQILV